MIISCQPIISIRVASPFLTYSPNLLPPLPAFHAEHQTLCTTRLPADNGLHYAHFAWIESRAVGP